MSERELWAGGWDASKASAHHVTYRHGFAWVAQLVERVLGKDEVTGSIPVPGSTVAVRGPRG